MTGWDSMPSFGSPVPQAVIEAIRAATPPRASTSTWVPVESVDIVSGAATVGETTLSLSSLVTVPAFTTTLVLRVGVAATGGSGSVTTALRHKPGGADVAAIVATAGSAGAFGQALVDANGGRVTYVVSSTGSPTGVSWDIRLVGFLRSA